MSHQGDDRSNSSPLLRQTLQPLQALQPPATTTTTTATPTWAQGPAGDTIIYGNGDDNGGDDDGGDIHGGSGDDENYGDGEDDDDNDNGHNDDGHGGHGNDGGVAESVVSIVDGMGLVESEAAALRLAIACGDANIRGALELFRFVGHLLINIIQYAFSRYHTTEYWLLLLLFQGLQQLQLGLVSEYLFSFAQVKGVPEITFWALTTAIVLLLHPFSFRYCTKEHHSIIPYCLH